jgi:hypothetical protein
MQTAATVCSFWAPQADPGLCLGMSGGELSGFSDVDGADCAAYPYADRMRTGA